MRCEKPHKVHYADDRLFQSLDSWDSNRGNQRGHAQLRAPFQSTTLLDQTSCSCTEMFPRETDQQSNVRVLTVTTEDLFSCSTFNLIGVPALAWSFLENCSGVRSFTLWP